MKVVNLDNEQVSRVDLTQTGVIYSGHRISSVFSDVIDGEEFAADMAKSQENAQAWKEKYEADFRAQMQVVKI